MLVPVAFGDRLEHWMRTADLGLTVFFGRVDLAATMVGMPGTDECKKGRLCDGIGATIGLRTV